MKHLGRIERETGLNEITAFIESFHVGEMGILNIGTAQFEILRMPNSSTFVLRSGGIGIGNGSSAEVTKILQNLAITAAVT